MKQKHIDAFREVRLWIGQIIVPAATLAATIVSNQDMKRTITTKCEEVKDFIDEKIKNKEAVSAYYTQHQWDYIQDMVTRKERNELTEKEWNCFKAEWMV